MINSFKDPEQLKMLCDSQYKTIIEQSKRIQELENENKLLKEENKAKAVFSQTSQLKIPDQAKDIIKLDSSEQEVICKLQLLHLRNVAINRELTLEEARKLEIYSKILNNLAAKGDSKDAEFKKLSDDDLIKELSDESES